MVDEYRVPIKQAKTYFYLFVDGILQVQSNLYIKATQENLTNVAFMSSCPVYTG